MDFCNQNFFGPNFFLTKTISITTTTIMMGFDTIEINLVSNESSTTVMTNISLLAKIAACTVISNKKLQQNYSLDGYYSFLK